jgi:hypothetical protein
MQVELKNYTVKTTNSQNSNSSVSKTTSDGYLILEKYSEDAQVNAIMKYLN